ncbi:oxidoreductase [Agrobacterium vitis]|uniref:VOC family protein n=1 Tax=Rhizobium/Agrobacterium group TaxID=227290 RepID=UPI0012E8C529|nr:MULTISPECIES: VOC family protein [Rhizobium/Agrobacterium group]MCF1495726.1 oxidoreductase [Allorhizobium ampelinum]MVA45839.1 oxidoreductase [Agrobacterium vitis]
MTYLIRQMGHVVISSPDPLGAAKDLCEVVGLRITEVDGDTVYLTSNDRHHEVTYIKGDGKAVACGLEAVSASAVDEVYRRAKSDGLEILSDRPLGKHYERAVRLVAPGGTIFEVHTPITRNQPRHYSYSAPGARPRRIEHINSFAPDTAAFGEFCQKGLGMKLSDMTEDGALRWYRAEDGYHHTIAMGPGESGLHHYAFDLHSLQDLQTIADNLAEKDRALVWGPGRHGAGGNIFTYYADPHGCLVENSIEIDRIDNDATYEPRSWDISEGLAGRWLNLWGTPPTASFLRPGIPFDVTA